MNHGGIVKKINRDKRLKVLLYLILIMTIFLFLKIFYEYYIFSENNNVEQTSVVLSSDEENIKYSETLTLGNGTLNINNQKINVIAEYAGASSYSVYLNINNATNNLRITVTDSNGESQKIDLSNRVGSYLVTRDYTIDSERHEWTFEISGTLSDDLEVEVTFVESSVTIADYIIEKGDNGLYYVESDGTYRFVGSDPNNYISINDELYRIIGIFDGRLKVIKNDYATSEMLGYDGAYYNSYQIGDEYYKGDVYDSVSAYYWNNDTSNNNWEESNLNTVNLNTNFRNYLGASKDLVDGDIMLMDIEDYYYASYPEFWGIDNYVDGLSTNYLYMGLDEWTMSKVEDTNKYVYFIYSNGLINENTKYGLVYNISAVRPVFYLKDSVLFLNGNGSKDDPYEVSI